MNSDKKYLIDTDVLVHIRLRKDSDAIYAGIEKAVKEGWLRTVKQVPDEVKKWPKPYAKIAPFKSRFIVPASEQYCDTVKAMNELVLNLAPLLIAQVGGKNPDPADSWLIAVAKAQGYTLVTNENALSPVKIPAVCKLPQIKCPCISGPHFLLETGIVTEIKPEHISVHAFYGLGGA